MNKTELITTLEYQFVNQFDTWINNQIFNNDFLIAGIFTVLASAGLFMLRNVPGKIWAYIKKRSTIEVVVNNDNYLFVPITEELNKNSIKFLSRTKVLDKERLTIGFSRSFTFFGGRFAIVLREKEKSDSRDFKQNITITFPLVSSEKVADIFAKFIENQHKRNIDKTSIYSLEENYLAKIKNIPHRNRDSIFINEDYLEKMEKSIDDFLRNKQWYKEKGIPYKFGLLLYGPPGTGKTSIAKYIAAYTDRDLILCPPNKLEYVATSIRIEVNDYYPDDTPNNRAKRKYVILMEDIDCFSIAKARKNKISVQNNIIPLTDKNNDEPGKSFNSILDLDNLSTLLNALDGLKSPEDVIIIATTNDIEALDPAIIRPGRFDELIFIGPLSDKNIKKMIKSYIIDSKFLAEIESLNFEPVEGAKLQHILLSNLKTPDKILEELKFEKCNFMEKIS